MTKLILFVTFLISATAFAGDVYHRGYTRKDGTYVQPHYQTAPDNTKLNNYSTQGNHNPYTGKEGTVDPYRQPSSNTSNSYETQRSNKRQNR